jgi:hypothetical protein
MPSMVCLVPFVTCPLDPSKTSFILVRNVISHNWNRIEKITKKKIPCFVIFVIPKKR